jgi:phage shock protein A
MAVIKTVKDLEDLQRQMNQDFEHYLDKERGAKPAPRPEDLPTMVAEAHARLDAAINERQEGLRIADQRIERLRKEVAALDASLRRTKETGEKKVARARPPKARRNAVDKG